MQKKPNTRIKFMCLQFSFGLVKAGNMIVGNIC